MDWCFVSKRHGESMAPLFLQYVLAQKFWSLVFCLYNALLCDRGVIMLEGTFG